MPLTQHACPDEGGATLNTQHCSATCPKCGGTDLYDDSDRVNGIDITACGHCGMRLYSGYPKRRGPDPDDFRQDSALVCEGCGDQFDNTAEHASRKPARFCPACRTIKRQEAAARAPRAFAERLCRTCGAEFLGGPNSKDCPPCRIKIRKRQKHAHYVAVRTFRVTSGAFNV